MSKKNLFVLCGIPASGKSSWAKVSEKTFKEKTIIVSRDQIRYSLLKPEDEYFSKEEEVFYVFVETIKNNIKNDNVRNIIVDATHISKNSRRKLIKALGEAVKECKITAVVFTTSFDTCMERNSLRTGRAKVPVKDLTNMYNNFTLPLKSEGFDDIELVFE